MAEPTSKSPQIEEFLQANFGRTDAIEADLCIPPPVGCGQSATSFRDARSAAEYRISGLCQNCQDTVFGVDGDE